MTYHAVVPLPPVPAARPRFGRTRRGEVTTRTSDRHRDGLDQAIPFLRAALKGVPFAGGPVDVYILAVLPRPRSRMGKAESDGLLYAPVKPDADNLAKLYLDALVKAGVLADDNLVVDLRVSKRYAERAGIPRVEVSVCWSDG